MTLTWQPTQHGQATTEGYQITTTGDHTQYHTAYQPGERIPANELCAGAGEFGLVKCRQYCERHFEGSRAGDPQPDVATQPVAPISNNAVQPGSNNQVAPSSNNVPQSPAQTALF